MQVPAQIKGIFTAQGWHVVKGTHSMTIFEKAVGGVDVAKVYVTPDVGSYQLDAIYTQSRKNLLSSVKSEAPYYLHPDELDAFFIKALKKIDSLLEQAIIRVA